MKKIAYVLLITNAKIYMVDTKLVLWYAWVHKYEKIRTKMWTNKKIFTQSEISS